MIMNWFFYENWIIQILILKTKPKCSNNSNSLTQVKAKIFMLRVSSQLSQEQLHFSKMSRLTPEKKVSRLIQHNNKQLLDSLIQLLELMDSKQGKLQKVWRTEPKVLKHILSQSIKNLKRMNLIENKPGIFFSIKCKS